MLLVLREQEYRSCLFYAFFKADRFRSRNGSMIYSPLFLEDKSRHSTSQLLLLSHIFDGLVWSVNIATFDIMASKECRIFNRDVPLSVRSISSYLCYRNPHFWPQPKRTFLCDIAFSGSEWALPSEPLWISSHVNIENLEIDMRSKFCHLTSENETFVKNIRYDFQDFGSALPVDLWAGFGRDNNQALRPFRFVHPAKEKLFVCQIIIGKWDLCDLGFLGFSANVQIRFCDFNREIMPGFCKCVFFLSKIKILKRRHERMQTDICGILTEMREVAGQFTPEPKCSKSLQETFTAQPHKTADCGK